MMSARRAGIGGKLLELGELAVGSAGYSNWELSTDRANSSRRALMEAGLPPGRIASVIGLADTEHLVEDEPLSPRNRRISIVLLRENPVANLHGTVEPNACPGRQDDLGES